MNGWLLGNTWRANNHWQSGKSGKKWYVRWGNTVIKDSVQIPQNSLILGSEHYDQYYKTPYFTAPCSYYATLPNGKRADYQIDNVIFLMMGVTYTIAGRRYFNNLEDTSITDQDNKVVNVKTEFTNVSDITEGFWKKTGTVTTNELKPTRRGKGTLHATFTIGNGIAGASSFQPLAVIGEGVFTVEIKPQLVIISVNSWQFNKPDIEMKYGQYQATLIQKPVTIAVTIPGSGGSWNTDVLQEDGYGFLIVK